MAEGRHRLRVCFLINSLNPGGAERQLCELVKHMDPERFEVMVVVSYDPARADAADLYRQVAGQPGVTLVSLHKRHGPLGYLVSLPRLAAVARRFGPDILHGYTEGNFPMLLVGGLLRLPVVWGIRRTSRDRARIDPVSRAMEAVAAPLSRFVDMIIFNSEAGRANHAAMGLRSRRMCVVPNGFDVERFRVDPDLRRAQRTAWGLPEGVPLVGIVGRLDPVKGHPAFLRAAADLAGRHPEVQFVCVGSGPVAYAQRLRDLAAGSGIGDRVLWAGTCTDMTSVYNALDLLVLASTDEGFPNVLGEAMACGVPCVTTRVGDAAVLVGEVGLVVEPGDAAGLAVAASRLLAEPAPDRERRARAARERVCDRFSVEALARTTGQLLEELVQGRRA